MNNIEKNYNNLIKAIEKIKSDKDKLNKQEIANMLTFMINNLTIFLDNQDLLDLFQQIETKVKQIEKICFIDPISTTNRIVQGVKFSNCDHGQCFDKDNFLKLYNNQQQLGSCPICRNKYNNQGLVVDQQFNKYLNKNPDKQFIFVKRCNKMIDNSISI